MQTDTDPLLTVGEAARRLGVSVDSLRNWDDDPKFDISAERTAGGHRRFRASEIERFRSVRETA